MTVPDEALSNAFADALCGVGILFLTPLASETDGIVARARKLTVDRLVSRGFEEADANALFMPTSPSPWWVSMKGGGWVFFYPVLDLEPQEDVGHPLFVYVPLHDGAYERVPYKSWRTKETQPRPRGSQTVWDRLLDDD